MKIKKPFLIALAITLSVKISAQQKDFEGTAVYKVEVKSNAEGISDKAIKNMLVIGENTTVQAKHGNFKQSSGIAETYYICKDEKAYLRIKGIDTLYYIDYASDTTQAASVSKSDDKKNIAGFECKLLTVKVGSSTKKYYYSPSLYTNPEYNKNNKIGRFDIFAKETSSFYLGYYENTESYSLSETCTSLKQMPVDDKVFELPSLPQKKLSITELIVLPEFSKPGGWGKYLEKNLNAELGAKYIKIAKGETSAEQRVIVVFMVDENGRTTNIKVLNKKDVHPKLAEEAIRVVTESPTWKPAKLFGEKIFYWFKLPVVFAASTK